jgi:hypothetical protein
LSQLRVVADLAGGSPGRNTVALGVMGVPERVSPPEIDRPNVHVWLDQEFGKSLQIEVVLGGKPAKGTSVLGKPTARPTAVAVSGPEGAVERVAQVVARVDVAGVSEHKTVTAEVEALDARGMPVSGVSLEPSKVTVAVPVAAAATKRVEVRPRIGRAPDGLRTTTVRVTPRTVLVKGAPETIEALTEVSTEWQGIGRQHASTTTYRVPLAFPSGVWPAEDVRSVEVQVSLAPIAPPSSPAPATGPPAEATGGRDVTPPAGAVPEPGAEEPPGAEGSGKAPPSPQPGTGREAAEKDDEDNPSETPPSGTPEAGDAKAGRPQPPVAEAGRTPRLRAAEPPRAQPKSGPAGDLAHGSDIAAGRGAKAKAAGEAKAPRGDLSGGKAGP